MKKKIKLVSIALAIFMILPMLFALVVSADGPAYPSYADAQDGDLLYKANFNGDTYWVNPGTETGKANAGWNWNQADKAILTGTVDSEDSGKANFKAEGAVQNSAWGADLASLPLEAGYSYTFKFTVTRTANNPIGLLIDGHHGAYVYAVRARIQKNGNALAGHSYVNYSDDVPAKSPSAETPSVQNFAITVEDVHIDSESQLKLFTYTLYVKGTNGGWIKIDEGVPVSDETRDTVGLYFYTYHNTDVDVSDVEVYKGNTIGVSGEYKAYADAQDGDVIYVANFKGDGIWQPKNGGISAWDSMITEVSEDGKSVVLTSERDHDKGRAIWGGALNTDFYTAVGSSYTVEFTVTAETEDQLIGFYPDGGTGFVVKPGMNQFSVGQWGDWTKVRALKDYFGSGSLTQTYAVEVAVSNELRAVNGGSYYTVTAYNLYVKNGENWSLVYALSDDVECNKISGVSQLAAMQWTTGDEDMYLKFFRSPSQNKSVTVSDMVVYKGLTCSAAQSKTLIPGNLNVNSFEDGELIWTVDFTDTENFTAPGALTDGSPTLNAVIDENDHGKVTLSVPASEDGVSHYWGGQIKGLPLDDEQQYTIFVTVERSAALSATDPVVGVSVDGKYYIVGDSSYTQITVGGTGKVRSAVKYSELLSNPIVGNHEADYSSTTEPFAQTIAIEIDGPNRDSRAIRVYALAEDGIYEPISNSDSSSGVTFMNANLSLYFFQNSAEEPVTIDSVKVYKGRTINALNAATLDGPTGEDPTGNEPTDKPADTTPSGNTDRETAATTAPSTAAAEQPAKKKGCKSALTSSWVILGVVTLSAVVLLARKKKSSDEI